MDISPRVAVEVGRVGQEGRQEHVQLLVRRPLPFDGLRRVLRHERQREDLLRSATRDRGKGVHKRLVDVRPLPPAETRRDRHANLLLVAQRRRHREAKGHGHLEEVGELLLLRLHNNRSRGRRRSGYRPQVPRHRRDPHRSCQARDSTAVGVVSVRSSHVSGSHTSHVWRSSCEYVAKCRSTHAGMALAGRARARLHGCVALTVLARRRNHREGVHPVDARRLQLRW